MTESSDTTPRPLVIDLGKVKKKRIKDLKAGRGPLLGEVHDAVEAVRRDLGAEAAGRELVPVVILYRPKRRKKGFFAL